MNRGRRATDNDNARSDDERDMRQRLALGGAGALSDAEILGILLKEGTNGNSATKTAERLLSDSGNSLAELSKRSILELRQSESLGMTRAATLAAAFELAVRIVRADTNEPVVIRTNADIEAIFVPILAHLKHEEMWIAYLTSGNRVIERRRISQGGITSLVTDIKIILKRGIELLASAIIIVHNHPSGVASPSKEDIEFTGRLKDAAAIFDIVMLDHLIVTDANESFSFRKNGQL